MSVTVRLLILAILLLSAAGCVHSGSGQVDVQQVFALRAEADALYEENRYAEALVVYQNVAKHIPKHPQTWLRIGNCQAQLGQHSAAEASYREALLHDSHYSRAWLNLAFVQAQQLATTAVAMYEQVPAGDPESLRIYALVEGVLAPFDILVQPRRAAEPELGPAPEPASEQQPTPQPVLEAVSETETELDSEPNSSDAHAPEVGEQLTEEEVDTDEHASVE